MKSPTIKQLRYFVALCEEAHFGRAAELSFVSQSAFSNAIKELEAQLVDRTNRNVTITAKGQEVATQARLVLREDGHCLRDHALAACRIRNTQKVRRFGASSLLTLIEMVDADLGITFLPELARDSALLKNTRVRLHALRDDSYRTVGLAWRKGSRRVDEFRLLGEFFRENR